MFSLRHYTKAFAYFDKDNSGYITSSELEAAIKEMPGMENIKVEDLIREVDKDSDGKVNYEAGWCKQRP